MRYEARAEGFDVKVAFTRADIAVLSRACTGVPFRRTLALMLVNVGSVAFTRMRRERVRRQLQIAAKHIAKARDAIGRLYPAAQLPLLDVAEALEKSLDSVRGRDEVYSVVGNPIDIGTRRMLHGLAVVFDELGLPVTMTGGETPSLFILIACTLGAARGKVTTADTMRKQAQEAKISRRGARDLHWKTGAVGRFVYPMPVADFGANLVRGSHDDLPDGSEVFCFSFQWVSNTPEKPPD